MAARAGIMKMTNTIRNIRHVQEAAGSGIRRLHGGKLSDRKGLLPVGEEVSGKGEVSREADGGCCWVPDYRTGIYYPKGHERVLDDIPAGAASFGGITFWLRNMDGVDKPHDFPSQT